MTFVVATLAGGVGAVCRYLAGRTVATRLGTEFPFGTLTVNVVGSFALGLVAGGADLDRPLAVAVVGFLGGFTTFSTWMLESVDLGIPPLRFPAVLNLALTLVSGVGAAAAGYALTV